MINQFLEWVDHGYYTEAVLGDFDGGNGARFSLVHYPTRHRRGPWRLLVEVTDSWGCFDEQDQPQRWYYSREIALGEAQSIASALIDEVEAELIADGVYKDKADIAEHSSRFTLRVHEMLRMKRAGERLGRKDVLQRVRASYEVGNAPTPENKRFRAWARETFPEAFEDFDERG